MKEKTKKISVPESMISAANALKAIAAGTHTPADLAEVALALNAGIGGEYICAHSVIKDGLRFLKEKSDNYNSSAEDDENYHNMKEKFEKLSNGES